MKEISRTLLTIALLFFMTDIINAQCYKIEIDTLYDSIVKIELPFRYRKKKQFYEEGAFIDFYYSNGAIVTIFKGALQHTPLYLNNRKCKLLSTDTINNKISYQGVKGDRFWHEIKINDLHIVYLNVPLVDKLQFDKCLESISIVKIEN